MLIHPNKLKALKLYGFTSFFSYEVVALLVLKSHCFLEKLIMLMGSIDKQNQIVCLVFSIGCLESKLAMSDLAFQ